MGGWSPRTRSVGLSPGDPYDEPERLEREQFLGRDADQEPARRRGLVILQHIPHETVGAYVAAAVMHAAFHLDRQPEPGWRSRTPSRGPDGSGIPPPPEGRCTCAPAAQKSSSSAPSIKASCASISCLKVSTRHEPARLSKMIHSPSLGSK